MSTTSKTKEDKPVSQFDKVGLTAINPLVRNGDYRWRIHPMCHPEHTRPGPVYLGTLQAMLREWGVTTQKGGQTEHTRTGSAIWVLQKYCEENHIPFSCTPTIIGNKIKGFICRFGSHEESWREVIKGLSTKSL